MPGKKKKTAAKKTKKKIVRKKDYGVGHTTVMHASPDIPVEVNLNIELSQLTLLKAQIGEVIRRILCTDRRPGFRRVHGNLRITTDVAKDGTKTIRLLPMTSPWLDSQGLEIRKKKRKN